jgi:DNA-binding NtrC family response regulator
MILKSILIIDDDENIRQSLAMILRRSGYRVTQAKDATSALECIQHINFDLVFLDIQLPDMDGLDLLAQVRETHPKLCFVVVSGTPFSSFGRELMPLRVSGTFTKPVDPDVILDFLAHTFSFSEAPGATN